MPVTFTTRRFNFTLSATVQLSSHPCFIWFLQGYFCRLTLLSTFKHAIITAEVNLKTSELYLNASAAECAQMASELGNNIHNSSITSYCCNLNKTNGAVA